MISSWCLTNYLIPDRQTVHSGERPENEEAIWHTIGVSPLERWRSKRPTVSGPGPGRFSLAPLFSHHLPEPLTAMEKGITLWAQPAHPLPLPRGTHVPTIRSNYSPPPAISHALPCVVQVISSAITPWPYLTLVGHVQNPSRLLLTPLQTLLEASSTFS